MIESSGKSPAFFKLSRAALKSWAALPKFRCQPVRAVTFAILL
jgi:hypothetical protein